MDFKIFTILTSEVFCLDSVTEDFELDLLLMVRLCPNIISILLRAWFSDELPCNPFLKISLPAGIPQLLQRTFLFNQIERFYITVIICMYKVRKI